MAEEKNGQQGQELAQQIEPDEKALDAIPQDMSLDFVERGIKEIERRAKLEYRLKKAMMVATSPRDWLDLQGKPYLAVSGCQKVASPFGISWLLNETPEIETKEGGHYTVKFSGVFTQEYVDLNGEKKTRSISAIGMRASDDPFFTTRHKWVNNVKKTIELTANEVKRADVIKSAYTNCIGNGVMGITGCKNITWEELAECGIGKQGKASVQYGKGKQQAPKQTNGKPKQDGVDPFNSLEEFNQCSKSRKIGVLGHWEKKLPDEAKEKFALQCVVPYNDCSDEEFAEAYTILRELIKKK